MVSARWLYDQADQAYRDARTGDVISDDELQDLANQFLDGQQRRIDRLMSDLGEQRIALSYWENAMRQVIKDSHGVLYVLGRGGRNAMHPTDWGRVGRYVQSQFTYLNGFARDIAGGQVSQAQAQVRAGLYIGSARAAMSRGVAAAAGGLALPQYPGDGSTPCLGNCRCWWQLTQTQNEWHARWISVADRASCEECVQRGGLWNPLVIPL
jgi:hypothetical protein